MGEPLHRIWSVAEFFAWVELQPDRYELVDGQPLKMMSGAKNVHDDIVVNLIVALGNQLRGRGCRPFTGDGSVETRPGQIRRPDVGVDCGPRDPNAMMAALPKLVVEVLSPSTRDFELVSEAGRVQGRRERRLHPPGGAQRTHCRVLVAEVRRANGPSGACAGWRRPSKCPIWR